MEQQYAQEVEEAKREVRGEDERQNLPSTLIKGAREKETGATQYDEGERVPSKESEEPYQSTGKGKPRRPKYVEQPYSQKEIEFEHDSDKDKPFDSPKQIVSKEALSPGRVAEESKFSKPTTEIGEIMRKEEISPSKPSKIKGQKQSKLGYDELEAEHPSQRSTDILGKQIKGDIKAGRQETYSKEFETPKDTEEEFELYHPRSSPSKQHERGPVSPSKKQTLDREILTRVGRSEGSLEEQSEEHISPTSPAN